MANTRRKINFDISFLIRSSHGCCCYACWCFGKYKNVWLNSASRPIKKSIRRHKKKERKLFLLVGSCQHREGWRGKVKIWISSARKRKKKSCWKWKVLLQNFSSCLSFRVIHDVSCLLKISSRRNMMWAIRRLFEAIVLCFLFTFSNECQLKIVYTLLSFLSNAHFGEKGFSHQLIIPFRPRRWDNRA